MTKYEGKLVAIWAILICLTVLSYIAGEMLGAETTAAIVSVVVAALVKVRFIMLDFMEIRHAPQRLRILLEGWIILLAGALCYFLV